MLEISPQKRKIKQRNTHKEKKNSNNMSMIVYKNSAGKHSPKRTCIVKEPYSPSSHRNYQENTTKIIEYPFNFIDNPKQTSSSKRCYLKSSRSPKYYRRHKRLFSPKSSQQKSVCQHDHFTSHSKKKDKCPSHCNFSITNKKRNKSPKCTKTINLNVFKINQNTQIFQINCNQEIQEISKSMIFN